MKQNKFKTKSSMICDSVRADIINEVLLPGTRLVVSEVAKHYKVSEIPVREAFQVLVQTGFITAEPNSSFTVSLLSKKDIREIFELRIVLETLGVELAVGKMAPEDLVLLQSILDNSQHFLQNDDFHGYWDSNRQWHLALYKIADNQRMLDMIQMLYQYSARYPAYFTDHERLIKSFSEHQMILNACATKNVELAKVLMKTHTQDSYAHVLEQFNAKEAKKELLEIRSNS